MKIRVSVILSIVLFIGHTGFCQIIWPKNTKPDDYSKLQGSKLIVALLDTTDKSQVFATDYNNHVRYAMKAYWTYCKYEFTSVADIAALKESNPDLFVMIPHEVETTNLNAKPGTHAAYFTYGFVMSIGEAKAIKINKKLIGKDYTLSFKKPLVSATTGGESFESVITSVKEMQSQALYTALKKSEQKETISKMRAAHSVLRTTTLYIGKSLLDKKMTEAEIRAIYHYPFKIVDELEIVNAIKTKKKDVAFIQIYPMSAERAYDALVVKSCADLEYLAAVGIERAAYLGERKLTELNNAVSAD